MGVDGQPVDFVTGSAWVIPTESDFPDQACEFIKTMTSSDAWIAAAEARAEAREADGLFFTGVYTGNTVADETIFGEMVQLDEGTYGPAVQAVLDAQEAAFSLPSPEPVPSSRPPGRTPSTGSWPRSRSRRRWPRRRRRPRTRSTRQLKADGHRHAPGEPGYGLRGSSAPGGRKRWLLSGSSRHGLSGSSSRRAPSSTACT